MKILIIGANSQIGLTFKLFKLNKNIEIFFCSKQELDITNFNSIKNIFNNIHPDIVINCAAYTNVIEAEKFKKEAKIINNLSLIKLSLICNEFNSLLIHFSTDYVFDGKSRSKYKEDCKTGPISYYGISKLEGEKNIINNSDNYIIFRVSWLYSNFKNNFVNFIVNSLQNNNKIFAINDLISIPTSSFSVVMFILDNINSTKIFNNVNEIYHLVNDGPEISWYDFAISIRENCTEYFESKSTIEPISASNFFKNNIRPKYSAMDNSKLLKTFNYKIDNWQSSLNTLIKRKFIS